MRTSGPAAAAGQSGASGGSGRTDRRALRDCTTRPIEKLDDAAQNSRVDSLSVLVISRALYLTSRHSRRTPATRARPPSSSQTQLHPPAGRLHARPLTITTRPHHPQPHHLHAASTQTVAASRMRCPSLSPSVSARALALGVLLLPTTHGFWRMICEPLVTTRIGQSLSTIRFALA